MKWPAHLLVTALLASCPAHAKPLKVFILAGQSNMEGPASVATFEYLGCAKTFALMGKTFAEASLDLQKQPKAQ
jgi:hypothetical protein